MSQEPSVEALDMAKQLYIVATTMPLYEFIAAMAKQLDAFAAQTVADHARKPDDTMVEAAAKALCADDGRAWGDGHFGTIRDSYRWKARVALAALRSMTTEIPEK